MNTMTASGLIGELVSGARTLEVVQAQQTERFKDLAQCLTELVPVELQMFVGEHFYDLPEKLAQLFVKSRESTDRTSEFWYVAIAYSFKVRGSQLDHLGFSDLLDARRKIEQLRDAWKGLIEFDLSVDDGGRFEVFYWLNTNN